VRYIRRERRGGAAAARNSGLAQAKGTYIAFQDSDDIWLPGKLSRQVALLSSLSDRIGAVTGAKIIYGRDAAFNHGPAKIAYAPAPEGRLRLDEDQIDHLLWENRISLQNALFRKNCLAGDTWFDSCALANNDWEFAVRLVQHTTIYEGFEPVVLGFISGDSISVNFRKRAIGMLRIFKKNKKLFASKRRQRSALFIQLSRCLYYSRKKKLAIRLLAAALWDHPAHVLAIGRTLLKKLTSLSIQRTRRARLPVPDGSDVAGWHAGICIADKTVRSNGQEASASTGQIHLVVPSDEQRLVGNRR